MKPSHRTLSDDTLVRRFERLALDAAVMSHEAHLRIAWIYLERFGLKAAVERMCIATQAFARHVGSPDKYHATVTAAAVRVVHHFRGCSPGCTFAEALALHPRLQGAFLGLLHAHYSRGRLWSESARREELAPDLVAFP